MRSVDSHVKYTYYLYIGALNTQLFFVSTTTFSGGIFHKFLKSDYTKLITNMMTEYNIIDSTASCVAAAHSSL